MNGVTLPIVFFLPTFVYFHENTDTVHDDGNDVYADYVYIY